MDDPTEWMSTRKQKSTKSYFTACITCHVDSNGYATEDPRIGLSSSRTSTQASIDFAIDSKLYPPSKANTIFPSAKFIN